MNDTTPTPAPVQDDRFGELRIRLEGQESLLVEGEGIPRITLNRAPDSEKDDHIAIGTRDPEQLTLRIDGTPAKLTPSRGRLTRRSYAVDVDHAGTSYRLVPDSVPSSRLVRDGRHIGDFSSDGDGHVIAEWREDAEIVPLDAALGYTLAAAFGTGAQPMWMMAIDAVATALP
ncbi:MULTISPECIES: hypothetical protein [unclassified Streptomyces]|uniref:hypothetical protein n=1 Tax=unclassified Streptomyces TaxID=2593676 RepID=UPI002E2A5F3C|nr:hypothetical protein [Streptomyces sp. NBC_00306]